MKTNKNKKVKTAISTSQVSHEKGVALRVGCDALLGSSEFISISCVDEQEKSVSKMLIKASSLIDKPYFLERALNRMVDEINATPSSLMHKAFRVRSEHLSHTVQSE